MLRGELANGQAAIVPLRNDGVDLRSRAGALLGGHGRELHHPQLVVLQAAGRDITAKRQWGQLIDWMSRSRLEPMMKVSRTLREHLWGIINAIVLGATNAHLESVNAKIQALKKRACGYRNRARFRYPILFRCGELDPYPRLA